MAWAKSTTTKHTCNMAFGRKTPGCPRCDELLAGAEPVRWDWADRKKKLEALNAKYKTPQKIQAYSGGVCTANEW